MTPGCRDPAIKLFGRTIPLPPVANTPPISGEEFSGEYDAKELSTKEDALESPNNNNNNNNSNTNEKDRESSNSDEKSSPPSSSSASDTKIDQKAEEQAREAMESQEKQTKKPDKIIPCPRCNSLDTKFCYFNNYNVNQPRHFCKHCQRYWTAGGTMRNIPVGAGRRKSKSSSSQYKHLTIPSTTLPTLKPNGTVLNFGADVCESMASVLNLAEKTSKSCSPNGVEKMVPFSCKLENGGEEHCNSSPEAKVQGFAAHQWPYPWSPIAIPIYPAAAYWGCAFAGAWNVPWLSAFPTDATASVSGPNSPTLGKHTRDGLVLSHSSNAEREETRRTSDPERCLWIPKTLRIDDPEEAAKSSIWSSIGIKNDKVDGVRGGGLFNAFRSKTEIKNHTAATSPAFHANPAALARSLNFQESS